MAWDLPTYDESDVKKPVKRALWRKVIDCLAYLYGTIGTLSTYQILNGCYEVDSDGDGIPDSHSFVTLTGGSGTLDATAGRIGKNAFKITHPGGSGNGGGILKGDYMPIGPDRNWRFMWMFWATNAGVHNKMEIEYYDKDKVIIGSPEILYDSTTSPTSVTKKTANLTVPSTSRYYKYKWTGGLEDTDPVSSTKIYIDCALIDNDHDFETGSVVVGSSLNEASTLSSATPTTLTLCKEMILDRDGDLSSLFWLKRGGSSGVAEARIYVNGSPKGDLQTASSSYVTKVDTLLGLKRGDKVQLFLRHDSGGGDYALAKGWVLKSDQPSPALAVSQEDF